MKMQKLIWALTIVVLAAGCAAPPRAPSPRLLPATTTQPTATHSQVFTSPDGRWKANVEVEMGTNSYTQTLRVFSSNDTTQWAPINKTQDLLPGYTSPRILAWSQDGTGLFFTNNPVPDGCALFANGSDLQRLNLQTGNVREVVSQSAMASITMALSPDETILALIRHNNGPRLVLRNLATGIERETILSQIENDQAGEIIWWSNSQHLVLTVAHNPCSNETSLTAVDIDMK